jgi:hypothetical protein
VNTPDIPPPPVDPNLAAEQQQAQNNLVKGLQSQSQGDMASLMARYGTQLAFAGGGGGSPLSTPVATSRGV